MPNQLIHRSVWYERTTVDDDAGKREKAFADAWEKENEPREHFARPWSGQVSTLQALMRRGDKLIPVSQKSATAVATIVQWLGAPIGWCFLESTLKQAGYVVLTREQYEKLRARPQG
jgi:hypothetical protein